MTTTTTSHFLENGKKLIQQELQALQDLVHTLDKDFVQACETITNCSGRVIVTGVGKSGHIGRKIAATLASTGTPAYFVHPTEACHGDFGMITNQDVILMISYSGEAEEIITLLPMIKRLTIPTITMSGSRDSTLGQHAQIFLSIAVPFEACPLRLAPTSSTTKTLVLGDALAVAVLTAKGFSSEDFAFSHPGGKLGRKLLLKVTDLMHTGTAIPMVSAQATIADTLVEMSAKGFGLSGVQHDTDQTLIGIFTDGDLRRTLEHHVALTQPITEVMTTSYRHVLPSTLAVEALSIMETHKITALMVVNTQYQPTGIIHLHDLLDAKIA